MALLCPALSLLLIIACWTVGWGTIHSERHAVYESAQKDANLYARAYEQYVTRSVGQMDQVAMQLKQSWEQSGATLNLRDLYHAGMFTDAAFVEVSIADSKGRVHNSSRPQAAPRDVHDTESFVFHKNNNSTALRIGVASEQDRPIQNTVEFTRRLETPDDNFAGVLILTIDASYFTAFYNERVLGHDGMVALLGESGNLRLEQHGDAMPGVEQASLLLGQLGFGEHEGVRWMDGGTFSDSQARLLSWRKSPAYPVVAYVGMSQRELLQATDAASRDILRNCALATAVLLLLGLWGTRLARRAVSRQHEEDEVRRAYRTATESANEGFYMASAIRDPGGRITDFEIIDCNERGAQFYGLRRADLVGSRVLSMSATIFGENLLATYVAAMESGFYEDDRQLPAAGNGQLRWGHRRLVRVGNGLAITLQDVSERKLHEQELERLANEDALTRLPNRYWLNRFLPDALAAAAEAGSSLALLFIDLDDFKHVNDTQGHTTGDLLLREAAARLKSLMRKGDHVVRFGGDEFVVLLAPAGTDRQIIAVAERILTAIAEPFSIGDESQSVGASIGISVFPRDGNDPENLIKHGDIAMYSGKSEGKGQYRFFDPLLFNRLKSHAKLRYDLQQALDRDELHLYYQPRVDTKTGELRSMEALVRWIHPELGMIPPLEFIPLAEASGLIIRVGEIVMAQACAQIAAWRNLGLSLVPVSINVSPKQFSQGSIHRQLAIQMDKYQVESDLLEVEITESAMMGDQEEILAELSSIRALGIKLHVDDFGTGYSSLSQLQKLKMDVLKVDKAFTMELDRSREGRIFFQAIVSMAHALGMAVVAEGVETAEQLAILQEMNCNEVQGYYFARPMPADQMASYMQRRFLVPERRTHESSQQRIAGSMRRPANFAS
ncbi:MAG: EAL domain-containing protein [Pseudomonadota bacterium]